MGLVPLNEKKKLNYRNWNNTFKYTDKPRVAAVLYLAGQGVASAGVIDELHMWGVTLNQGFQYQVVTREAFAIVLVSCLTSPN